MSLITVAIPVYKAKYLLSSIQSVLNQTYKIFELLIVNDCSKDNIKDIVKSLSDDRIRYFENKTNLGGVSLVKSWNKCLELAQGEFFVLLSDDDILEPTYLEILKNLADKYPSVNIFHCRPKLINENGDVIGYGSSCPEYETVYNFIWHRIMGFRLQFVSDFMLRTNRLHEIGGFYDLPLGWGSDDVTWYLMAKNGGIVSTALPLFNFRYSSLNISRTGNIEIRIDAIELYRKWMIKFLSEIEPKINDEKSLQKQIKENLDDDILRKKRYLINILLKGSINHNSLKTLLKFRNNRDIKNKTIFNILLKKIFGSNNS